MASNVRARPNVICTRLYAIGATEDDVTLRDWQVVKRIAYWEILEFSRECPLRFSGQMHRLENLTDRQKVELEKYLDPGRQVRHLWPETSGSRFEPFPPTQAAEPFFAQPVEDNPSTITPPATEVSDDSSADAAEAEEGSEIDVLQGSEQRLESGPTHDEEVGEEVDEQESVIQAPMQLHQLVLAPPGTGKTHVLVKRLRHLIFERAADNPSTQILVLSFSRAAVAEVTRRLEAELDAEAHDDLRYIQVRTFDSYATRMLSRGESNGAWLESGYEKRINQFRNAIRNGSLPDAAQEELAELRFLIVDELQDLVGERAHMTQQMIEHVQHQGGTVLLLGDPAQAIYDWQLAANDTTTSSRFLLSAKATLAGGRGSFRECELQRYRRFENAQLLSMVRRCRQAIGKDGSQPDLTALTNQLQELPVVPLPHLRDAADSIEAVAVLTRTNLEAFQISEWCRNQCIPHRVERGSSGRYWPGWIARLCFEYKMDRMSLSVARKRWNGLIGDREWTSFEQAHEYLRSHGLFGNDVLDIRDLSNLIDNSSPCSSWPPEKTPGLSISTIHRSKGLEFDRVFLLKAQKGKFSAGDADEGEGEARLLYVAATRAKRNIAMLMRDRSVLLKGNKYCKGYSSSKLNHFHLFDFRSKSNFLLLDGVDEFDLTDLVRSTSVRSLIDGQNEIWEMCAGNSPGLSAQRVDGDLSWVLPSNRRFCSVSRDLSSSAATLGKTFRGGNASAVRALRNVPLVDLASVSFPWEGGVSLEQRLGPAKLAMIPVVYGLAQVELTA